MSIYKSALILCIFAVFASLLSFASAFAQDSQETRFPVGNFDALKNTGSAQVLEVISPLMVKLSNGHVVRLTGLHFPDYHFTDENIGPFALTGLKILKDMFEGERVEIYQTTKKDFGRVNRMGHDLAHLVRARDDAWAQGTMVGLGLAQVKTSQRNIEMADQLYALETAARNGPIGLWDETAVLTPESAEENLNSFQIVEGVVASAALKKNRVYLNFGSNWRDDFTVSIAPEDRRLFSKASINPLDWNGKTLRVRGWVEEYNGAYIEIDHPQAVEVLD